MAAQDQEVARLLQEREARGLRAPAMARILFAAFGLLSILGAQVSSSLVLIICVFTAATLGINTYFLHLLHHKRRVKMVGWLSILLDIFNVAVYPLIMKAIYATHGIHWIYGARTFWIVVCVTFMAIGALALRPLYPTVVGAASIVAHVVVFLIALDAPGVLWSNDFRQQIEGPPAAPMITSVIFLVILTTVFYFITRSARRTVEEAVARQAERARLVREHAASIMDGRLDALRNLVASLSHEMNTPLGAIKSASATMVSAVRRLSGEVEGSSEKVERMVRRIEETAAIPEEASARLEESEQEPVAGDQMERWLAWIRSETSYCDWHGGLPVGSPCITDPNDTEAIERGEIEWECGDAPLVCNLETMLCELPPCVMTNRYAYEQGLADEPEWRCPLQLVCNTDTLVCEEP